MCAAVSLLDFGQAHGGVAWSWATVGHTCRMQAHWNDTRGAISLHSVVFRHAIIAPPFHDSAMATNNHNRNNHVSWPSKAVILEEGIPSCLPSHAFRLPLCNRRGRCYFRCSGGRPTLARGHHGLPSEPSRPRRRPSRCLCFLTLLLRRIHLEPQPLPRNRVSLSCPH